MATSGESSQTTEEKNETKPEEKKEAFDEFYTEVHGSVPLCHISKMIAIYKAVMLQT